jgi:hypothetical protein
MKSNSI